MSSSSNGVLPGAPAPRQSRRSVNLALMAAAVELVVTSRAEAETVQVPIAVQAGLLAKVAGFDRNFSARARGKAVVLLAGIPDDAESMRAAMEMKGALSQLDKVGDLQHEDEVVRFSGAAALAELVRARRAAIVYFGPGFGKHVPAVREAFATIDVLTVAAIPEYVAAGIVLGFDLVSGRSKLLVNLAQARRQQVAFPASVLNLMKVYK